MGQESSFCNLCSGEIFVGMFLLSWFFVFLSKKILCLKKHLIMVISFIVIYGGKLIIAVEDGYYEKYGIFGILPFSLSIIIFTIHGYFVDKLYIENINKIYGNFLDKRDLLFKLMFPIILKCIMIFVILYYALEKIVGDKVDLCPFIF